MTTPNLTSVPAKGAIERDWTNETLVLDLTNSLGEHFHFEVEPNEVDNLPVRPSDSPADKDRKGARFVNMHLPIL
jgi:hypothetical protein